MKMKILNTVIQIWHFIFLTSGFKHLMFYVIDASLRNWLVSTQVSVWNRNWTTAVEGELKWQKNLNVF